MGAVEIYSSRHLFQLGKHRAIVCAFTLPFCAQLQRVIISNPSASMSTARIVVRKHLNSLTFQL